MNIKKCARCQQTKDIALFKSLKTAKDGLKSWCMNCYKEYGNTHVPNKPKLVAQKEDHKVCRKCTQEKPFSDFYQNKKIESGLTSWCASCISDYNKNRCNPIDRSLEPHIAPFRKSREVLLKGTKRCTSCKEIKAATSEVFAPIKRAKTGIGAKCLPCFRAINRASRERNKDKINKYNRDRRTRKPKEQHRTVTRWLVDGKEPTRKVCRGYCGLEKPVAEFRPKAKKLSGHPHYNSRCKECESRYHKMRRSQNPAWAKENDRKAQERRIAIREAKREQEPKPKEGHRFCIECGVEKLDTLDFFDFSPRSRIGRTKKCSDCIHLVKVSKRKLKWSDKEGYKFCRGKCGLELPFDKFGLHKGNRLSKCKPCEREELRNNPERRAILAARSRINKLLFSRLKNVTPELGCTPEEFRNHIESQFLPGMTWRNYGEKWHIDHHYPLSIAIRQGALVYAKACHYTNLRPLWAYDNMKKHNKIPEEFKNVQDFLNHNPISLANPKPPETKKPFSWDN
jgi:hypothetical protein